MSTLKMWQLIPALLLGFGVGMASAKLPAPPPMDPAKAEAAKAKKAMAAKKNAEDLSKAMDRSVEYYKRTHGGGGMMKAKK